jgi:NAD+ kinase
MAAVEFLDMPVTGTVDDTLRAARMMREAGVAAIVVLGGDGTHRAVVRECGDVPIVGLSTGTNNAFPEMREPTITGLATGLFASGRIPAWCALANNKRLDITIRERDGAVRRDIALVDAVISREQYIGARAVWKTDTLAAVYVSYASPQAIGLSAIAGLLEPIGRNQRGGLAIELGKPGRCAFELIAPIAPGLMRPVPIAYWHRLEHAVPQRVQHRAGIVALDGERELAFGEHDEVFVTLHENAFKSIDVAACMSYAAGAHLMRSLVGKGLPVPEFHTLTP